MVRLGLYSRRLSNRLTTITRTGDSLIDREVLDQSQDSEVKARPLWLCWLEEWSDIYINQWGILRELGSVK